ncbi:T9SS type A sorting domain-containing protein [Hymenobacter gummosus]|uniref:T9SS type A sorting domain-containing protein n=1 Tax=Hymenobacter gummosus TaxID=1776032 RepID=A0A3S0JDV0_9BACT|nr:T9SS type A sorting domain-containing protein [Hymenobacter gummosus]RTQ53575.1 T9SS type A sorting domain-containing protein [Hymenobacter gummosus]
MLRFLFCWVLLGTASLWAGGAPPAYAQAPRLVVDHFYPHTAPRYPTLFNDAVFTPQGNVLVSGPQANDPLQPFHNRFLLLSPTTLDTLWTAVGLDMRYGMQRLVPGPGNQFTFCGHIFGSTPPTEWALQIISPAGRVRRTAALPPSGAQGRAFGAALRTPDGGLLWAGSTFGASDRRRAELVRTDSAGTVLWRREQGWDLNDYQTDAAYTNTGTVLLAGVYVQPYTGPITLSPWGVRLLEVTARGDSVRGVRLAPRGLRPVETRYGYHRLLPLADGGFVLPADGDTTLNGRREVQPLLLKVDRQLRLQWWRAYRASVGLRYFGTVALADGSLLVLVAGRTSTYYLHRYDAQGRLLNEYRFVTTACPNLDPIKLLADPTGRFLFVGGGCEGYSGGGAYAAIIDLAGLPSVVTAAAPARPAPAALLQLYPNPAHEQATVRVARAGTVRLLDAVGRVVHQQAVRAGQNRLAIGTLPAGLYACQLVQDGRVVAVERLQIVR